MLDARYCYRDSVRLSVRPSVRPSVTLANHAYKRFSRSKHFVHLTTELLVFEAKFHSPVLRVEIGITLTGRMSSFRKLML